MYLADSLEYLRRRAEDHVTLAQQSSNSDAVQAHYELASAYLDQIYGNDTPRPEDLPPGL